MLTPDKESLIELTSGTYLTGKRIKDSKGSSQGYRQGSTQVSRTG